MSREFDRSALNAGIARARSEAPLFERTEVHAPESSLERLTRCGRGLINDGWTLSRRALNTKKVWSALSTTPDQAKLHVIGVTEEVALQLTETVRQNAGSTRAITKAARFDWLAKTYY